MLINGAPSIELPSLSGVAWTILETGHWLSDVIRVNNALILS